MPRRLSFMVGEELFAAVERARGDVPRERWLRGVVERALDGWPAPVRASEPVGGSEAVLGAAPEVQREVSRRMSRVEGRSGVRVHAPNCRCPVCS